MNNNQKKLISRSHFLHSTGVIAAGLMFTPKQLLAQTSPVLIIKAAAAKDPVLVKALRGNIHMLEGSGGNIAVFHGPEGKLLVDGGIAVSQGKITDALTRIS